MRNPEKTHELILDAAEQVASEKGLGAMTLELVAQHASISKGGVLHHFPNKNALISGLMERLVERFDQKVESFIAEDSAQPGAYTRAYLRAQLDPDAPSADLCLTLISEARKFPDVMNLLQKCCIQWQSRVENDGLDPNVAAAIRFAGEGMSTAKMFGLTGSKCSESVVQFLLGLARGPESSH